MTVADKAQILICGTIIRACRELNDLRDQYSIIELEADTTRSSFFEKCRDGGEYNHIKGIYRHNSSAEQIGIFDAELIEALPESVCYICHNGAGYDQIDIEACTRRCISVSNTPEAVNDATATTAIYLMIGALRNFSSAERTARMGNFKTGVTVGHDPEGKVLGIVGMGGIGRALARRAIGFSMRIIYHNRHPLTRSQLLVGNPPFDLSPYVTYISSLDSLLEEADVVSLNLPLNAETSGSFGRREFNLMKSGSVLVNTARGAIVDEAAFLEALESGRLRAAGLDVYPSEPYINPRLIAHPRLSLLPHMGTESVETQHKMEVRALIENLAAAMAGKGLRDQVPEQL
ncbi:hypothetical protein CROQUDRAFT_131611 [Cronartium quercuum f. sp. fusiforme G11]|uniref:2-hydroxyacid dehydrogenase n=1 Tax=Cronartium quercuum f. sp. fusiforme G11 TaxID=708437 RepID=A0A9P6NRE5_9BASI|nr:hypothetical protein CROQUDRAFT_131611 [Cronartium quercuum f. sp. fusiforme G11]